MAFFIHKQPGFSLEMVRLLNTVFPSVFIAVVKGATYSLSDNVVGTGFLSAFSHQAIAV